MPKAYWVVTYREIKDPAKLAAYAKLAPEALKPYGVRYLCRGMPEAVFEHGMKERVVVSEFPSLEQAIAGHDCPAYAKAVEVLGDGAVRDMRIMQGLE
jgi:uncharacterized protein (DUF1330 family)